MTDSIVIMGVAGCGKSSLGAAVALTNDLTLVDGDHHHSTASRDKMGHGVALTDADREGWLGTLSQQLRAHPEGLVLTRSALKKTYRERLRQAAPGVRFVFLDISRAQAQARVAARAPLHFFPSSLVDSQFATLEDPSGEPGVLRVDALASLSEKSVRGCRPRNTRMCDKLTKIYALIGTEVGMDLWTETQNELASIRSKK
jgi:gluconokinase